MIDIILDHWNDIVTIGLFIVSVVTGIYKIQNIRSQQAEINILEVEDASYIPREEIEINRTSPIPNINDTVRTHSANANSNELIDTYYSVTVLLENNGRELATISNAKLILPDTDEVLELSNNHNNPRRINAHLRLDSNERDTVNFNASGKVRENYTDSVHATLRLDTTAGKINKSLELTKIYE